MDKGVGFPYVKRHLLQVGRADDSRLKSGNPFGSSSWGKPPRPDCLTTALSPQRSGSPTYNFFASI
ncbi:hypothetical protein [Halotia branconii]|uniref:Uncharacterized protein n=1 Tax=Halotia branconii CENA392 TaxID=1539056 RepID=A0AAJ6NXM3_9CYAN|nr:hypothetical protein [Halotia branconii]WGV28522.1 hypothetical protein QI031_14095 [Halotia branconii CENA392]